MDHITKLKEETHAALLPIAKVWDEFPWDHPTYYSNWLAQTYYYVRHSTRLLCMAGAYFKFDQEYHHNRKLAHMREEKSHEILALTDLRDMGYTPDDYPEYSITAAFYQGQYYMIQNEHPSALFGYILCLEGIAGYKGREIYEKIVKAHGHRATGEKRIERFMHIHAMEDGDHVEKAFHQLKNANEAELNLIRKSLKQSSDLYCEMIRTVMSGTALLLDKKAVA